MVALYVVVLHGDVALAGLAGAAHGVASVISETLFGRMGDRVDRRRLLTFGFAVAGLAYGLQTFATTPPLFVAARFLVGLAAGIVPATLVAYVFEIRRPLGTFTSFNALGWMVGAALLVVAALVPATLLDRPPFGLFVGGRGVYPLLFLASASLCLVGWVIARRLPPMKVQIDLPLLPWRTLKANVHVYASVFLRHLGASAVWITFPLYVKTLGGGQSDATVLLVTGLLGFVNMFCQITLFRLSDRLVWFASSRRLVASGLALSASAFVGYSLSTEVWHLIPSQILVGAGFAALWLGSLREVLEHNVERATATGLLNASLSLSNVAGPLTGGILVAALGFHGVMWFGAATTAVGLIVFLTLAKKAGARTQVPTIGPGPAGEVAP